MALELYYTSAPRGIQRSASGLCTVAATAGIPSRLARQLESFSEPAPTQIEGEGGDDEVASAYAHRLVLHDGTPHSVLSRSTPAGIDHTRRGNTLSYHLVLDRNERPIAGPAWLMRQPGVMASNWSGEPAEFTSAKRLPLDAVAEPSGNSVTCQTWAVVAGDAGWAGILAQAFLDAPQHPVYLFYPCGLDVLRLIDEALRLLPPRQRWRVTFNTNFTSVPPSLSCAWRCVRSSAGGHRPHFQGGMILDLTAGLGTVPDIPAAEAARRGDVLIEGD